MIDLETCILIAISGWVITGPLMDSDAILEPYRLWLERLPVKVGKPLGLCGVCFTGQAAFWYNLVFTLPDFRLDLLVFSVCFTIFTYIIIAKWMTKLSA